MSAYRPMFVVAPPAPPEPDDIAEEALRILRERQVQKRAELGRAPSWVWAPAAFEAWRKRRQEIDDMTPSEYDRIEARNRLREGRSVARGAP